MERVERRLAAILAADVAGYSRLIGVDEEGTLARLKAHRSVLIDPRASSSLTSLEAALSALGYAIAIEVHEKPAA